MGKSQTTDLYIHIWYFVFWKIFLRNFEIRSDPILLFSLTVDGFGTYNSIIWIMCNLIDVDDKHGCRYKKCFNLHSAFLIF